jgi:hypothetical protein
MEETHCILRIKTRIVEDTLYTEKFVVHSWFLARTKIPTCDNHV